jgi:hypothetical protein
MKYILALLLLAAPSFTSAAPPAPITQTSGLTNPWNDEWTQHPPVPNCPAHTMRDGAAVQACIDEYVTRMETARLAAQAAWALAYYRMTLVTEDPFSTSTERWAARNAFKSETDDLIDDFIVELDEAQFDFYYCLPPCLPFD